MGVARLNVTANGKGGARIPVSPGVLTERPARDKSSWLEESAADVVSLFSGLSEVQSYHEQPAGGIKLSHQVAALKVELPVLSDSRFSFFADFGFGATQLRSHEPGQIDSRYSRFSDTFLSGMGGLTAQYQLTQGCRAFVGARHVMYLDDADGRALEEAPSTRRLLQSSSWALPITFGLQLSFD
jgi:hypothetical protein